MTHSELTDKTDKTGQTASRQKQQLELKIEGMTCASCATHVEKQLNRLPGTAATVNLATEMAHLSTDGTTSVDDAISAVEAIGYGARTTNRSSRDSVPAVDAPPGPETVESQPVEADAGTERLDSLRRRVLVSAVLALPVLLFGMVPAARPVGWQWLSLLLTVPVVTWGAWPFHRTAALGLKHRAVTMDTLVSLGVTVTFAWSLYAVLVSAIDQLNAGQPAMSPETYLEVSSILTVFLLTGRYLEGRAKRKSGAALRALLDMGARDVSILAPGGSEQRMPIARLQVGDLFVLRPGERVATDGDVVDGTSAVDASMVTGEPVPVEVGPGSAVVGGTVNAGGRLVVRATRVGSDTQLAQMARLVQQAQSGKAPVQRLADRVSAVFVPVVILLSIVTLVGWLLASGSVEQAIAAAVAVLIIACPCALGLATPTALLVGTGRAAQLGILIRGAEVLESTRRIDTVVLDKTGTVTAARMRLVGVVADTGETERDVLRLAGAAEDASAHPIAKAITTAARDRVGALPAVTDFVSSSGLGVSAVVDGRSVLVGRPAWLASESALQLDERLARALDAAEAAGQTAVAVTWDGAVRGILTVADTVRPTSASTVADLRALGLRPLLLTGDNARAAHAVAADIGLDPDDVVAGVLPAGKVEEVRRLQQEGHVVAMVGDGVNDAAALAQADLGIAMHSGADAAIEAADLTLIRSDVRVIADAIRLSRRTLRIIKGNLFWAFAYNVAAIPLAMAGLLTPLVAGAAMAFSSVFVVSNSLRLRRFRPAAR